MAIPDLRGRVAVVTGGASGIGRGIAEILVKEGARVVLADIQIGRATETAAAIGASALPVDVTSPDSVDNLAREVIDRFGVVDIICNNAGVGSMGRVADLTLADWRWMLDVNLFGVIHGVRAFLPLLLANPTGGHVLNTSSLAGISTMPGLVPYSVAKFGVVALTEGLAQEMAEAGARVGATVLIPGPVRSDIGTSMRNRPCALGASGLADVELDDMADSFGGTVPWIEAVDAIRQGHLYAVTHPAAHPDISARHAAIDRAFGL